MPFHYLRKENQKNALLLWHIKEDEDALKAWIPEETIPEEVRFPNQQKEWLASRILTKIVVEKDGMTYQGIEKDEHGRPFVIGCHYAISLSHSFPYVVIQIGGNFRPGVDIEKPQKRLLKVAPRFLTEAEIEEAGENIEKLCVYWCAKEALYKAYSFSGIRYKNDLQLMPFTLEKEGHLTGIVSSGESVQKIALGYMLTTHYAVVYMLPPSN